jgi:hypothetical protein
LTKKAGTYVPKDVYEPPSRQLVVSNAKFKKFKIVDANEDRRVQLVFEDREDEVHEGVVELHESLMNITKKHVIEKEAIEAQPSTTTKLRDRYREVGSKIKSLRSEKELEAYGFKEVPYKTKQLGDDGKPKLKAKSIY